MTTPNVYVTVDGAAGTMTSATNKIYDAFQGSTAAAATAVNSAVDASSVNPGDPTTMIKMQIALANYSLALSIQSSVIKSIEETAKSITQKL